MFKLILLSGILFWPLNLFIVNTTNNFLLYLIPALLILISYYLKYKKSNYYSIPLFLIPFIEPKLALLSILFFALEFFRLRKTSKLVFFLISVIILIGKWGNFYGETIFVPDYQKRQEVLRNITLYNSVFEARFFQNKAKIVTEKFVNNFFDLIDPSNYFFGFAPRQIVGNQNIAKFPFILFPFFLYGFFKLKKIKHKSTLIIFFLSSLFSLSILTNFDRQDFILWPILSLFLIETLNIFEQKGYKFKKYIYFISFVFIFISYYQSFV